MNAHDFPNLANYMQEFLRTLSMQASAVGKSAFAVQVVNDGIAAGDAALLR